MAGLEIVLKSEVSERGSYRLILGARELVGLLVLTSALAPTLIFVGRITKRVEALEVYVTQHEATTVPLKEMLQRDHEIVLMLQESQKLMSANMTQVTSAISDNAREIAVLRAIQRK